MHRYSLQIFRSSRVWCAGTKPSQFKWRAHFDNKIRKCSVPPGRSHSNAKLPSEQQDSEEVVDVGLPSSGDKLMLELANCANYIELFDVLAKNKHNTKSAHNVQSLILQWNFYRSTNEDLTRHNIRKSVLTNTMRNLRTHLEELNANELSICYLYLRKMRIPNDHPVVQEILIQALLFVDTNDYVPLTMLSRLAVGINLDREFYTPLVCRHFVQHLIKHNYSIVTPDQARLMAICIFQLHPLIDLEFMSGFKKHIRTLLQNGNIGSHTPKVLLKVLQCVNLPVWSHVHTSIIRELLIALSPCLNYIDAIEAKSVCRIFLHHQEPGSQNLVIKVAAKTLMQRESSADVLACAVPFAEPQEREKYIDLFKKLLNEKGTWNLPNASGHFFSILRALKISDVKLCDAYWSGVVGELEACTEEQTQLRFLRHCHRYMNFNNNLGGTYRHMELERKLSKMAMFAIECDIAGCIPVKFARLAAFVLAYGHTPSSSKKLPNILLSKIITMSEQFTINDCLLISRGLQIACELR